MKAKNLLWCTLLGLFLFSALPGQVSAQKGLEWNTLEDMDIVKKDGKWVMKFGDTIQSYVGQKVKMEGFMMPLENTLKQKHFILSMLPLDGCEFCAPGTQAQFVEVKTNEDDGVSYTFDAILIEGTLELMPEGPMGVFYLIKDAKISS